MAYRAVNMQLVYAVLITACITFLLAKALRISVP